MDAGAAMALTLPPPPSPHASDKTLETRSTGHPVLSADTCPLAEVTPLECTSHAGGKLELGGNLDAPSPPLRHLKA
ncbi:hypothetical protein HETIRDRAFT_453267 [Heterobasidion irregulare TC 32-1]|uniref:Uncharacterized protein n=1 Tax=Heterobasidion irregulare (strain TC 32-1) TaxID=747525 RepID=W4JYM8_HETIT|nr:uncharacterized protein HETIRDRAFT_453267 [Heterobasidion irregulare TC 32-1]ETW78653.1 hypothetical protein HETIRDRAFT_453267 [Heterobasidion irregulare TC 32-1]